MHKESKKVGFWYGLILTVAIIVGFNAFLHIGAAVMIYDNATVLVKKDLCKTLSGRIENDACKLRADVKYSLIERNPFIKLQDGRIFEINKSDMLALSFDKYRYSLNW